MTTRPRTTAATTPKKVTTPKTATPKTSTAKASTAKAAPTKKTAAAKKPAARKRTNTKAAQPRRLPHALRRTGEVLMDRPPNIGDVAHRRLVVTDPDITTSLVVGALTAACRPLADGELPRPYAQFSAGWADAFYHAVACPDCFPNTSREATQ